MPNHVQNILHIDSYADAVLAAIKSDESDFDFNTIDPMPECMKIEKGSLTDSAIKFIESLNTSISDSAVLQFVDQFKRFSGVNISTKEALEYLKMGLQAIKNQKKYGNADWYEWSCQNWGTKWNAYNVNVDGNTVYFQTAWSNVLLFIKKLSKRFPLITFRYSWADEDFGSNVGQAVINGLVCDVDIPEDGSNRAFEMALKIRPDYAEYIELVDGEYRWKDD